MEQKRRISPSLVLDSLTIDEATVFPSQELDFFQSLSLYFFTGQKSCFDSEEYIDTHPPSLKFYCNLDPLQIHFRKRLK